ncbi:UNVERIFIED_CONTAM: hypothetical protein RMT77_000350 [Armadillidium vulgare]
MFRMIDQIEEWDIHLPDIISVYNHTYHREIKKTPAGIFLSNVEKEQNVDNTWGNKPKNYEPYKVNELVLRKNILKGHNVTNKLAKKYHGPYRIIKNYDNGVMYDIQHQYRNSILYKVHHKQLKKWYETPEDLKNVNQEQTLEDTTSEESQPDFEGFTEEAQNMFRINWEKVSKYNIQLRPETVEYQYLSPRNDEGSLVSDPHITYNMEPWIHSEIRKDYSGDPIRVITRDSTGIYRELRELEEDELHLVKDFSFNFSGFT